MVRRNARAEASQLPALLFRPADFTYRDLDADGRAIVAGLSPDGIIFASGIGWFRQSDSCFPDGARRRNGRRPFQPPAHCDRDPGRIHDSRNRTRAVDPDAHGQGLAHLRPGRSAGSRKRIRYSRAAVVPGGHGWPRRSHERDRAEFFDVQWRARRRPRDCRNPGREDRRGLVLLRKRRQLHRRHCGITDDEGRLPSSIEIGLPFGGHHRRLQLGELHRPDPGAAVIAGGREPGRHALHGIDAGVCGPHPAWRSESSRNPDGVHGHRCVVWGADARAAQRHQGTG